MLVDKKLLRYKHCTEMNSIPILRGNFDVKLYKI